MAVASSLTTDLHRIGEVQVGLPSPIVVLIGVMAVGAAVLPDIWLVTKHLTVMAHEGAHAFTGSALGRTVTSITMTRNGAGLTKVTDGGWAGNIAFWVAGYFGPSAFGVGAAELIRLGHVIAVLWLSLVALVLLMMPLRMSFGVLSVLGALALLIGFIRYATVGTQVVGGYGLAWFLLVSGVKHAWKIPEGVGDPEFLRGATRIRHGFWHRFWLAGSLAGLIYGAVLLV